MAALVTATVPRAVDDMYGLLIYFTPYFLHASVRLYELAMPAIAVFDDQCLLDAVCERHQ